MAREAKNPGIRGPYVWKDVWHHFRKVDGHWQRKHRDETVWKDLVVTHRQLTPHQIKLKETRRKIRPNPQTDQVPTEGENEWSWE